MDSTSFKIKDLFALAALAGCLLLLYSCDVLEPDVTPDESKVEVTGTEIHTISHGATYIDLYSMIKTQGTVRLDISSMPARGNLTEVSKGFLQYSPDQDFKKGEDTFQFSIFSEDNRLLKKSSIVIVVEDDTTNLPCGIYPVTDSVRRPVLGDVVINVLQNDFLCDSTNLQVEIYRPDESFPPYYGSATVQPDNTIRYTPADSSSAIDKIIYKVFSITDSSKVGYGVVYIVPEPSCEIRLLDDEFFVSHDSIRYDSTLLSIYQNDSLCAGFTSSVIDQPHRGTALIHSEGITYFWTDTAAVAGLRDSLIYEVCKDQQCTVAKVRIILN